LPDRGDMYMAAVKYQVFISSTFSDLLEDRQTAIIAILDAGHIPAGMELFKAGKPVLSTIYNWIDESDIFLNIVGGRYGSIDVNSGKSYSQLEFEYAKKRNKPIFSVILKASELHRREESHHGQFIDTEYLDRLIAFKELIQQNICSYYESLTELQYQIRRNLDNIISENKLIGWIRTNNVDNWILSKDKTTSIGQHNSSSDSFAIDAQGSRLLEFFSSIGLSEIIDNTGEWIPSTSSTPVGNGAPKTWETHPAIFINKWIDVDGIRTEAGLKYAYCPALNQGAKIVTEAGRFIVEQIYMPKQD
jgi:hypothetical protein